MNESIKNEPTKNEPKEPNKPAKPTKYETLKSELISRGIIKEETFKNIENEVAEEKKIIEELDEKFFKDWNMKLEISKKGRIIDSLQNIVVILENDKNLQGIAYNEHKSTIDVREKLPWKQSKQGWNDSDMSNLKVYLDEKYKIWAPIKTKEAVVSVASKRAFHPIKEYLNNLPEWDGIPRIDRLLIDYLGAKENEYSKEVIKKTLLAAVTRIFNPGAKFDTVLILNGPQGIGKSMFFSKLGRSWFSDSLTISEMRDKTSAEKLQGFWILELGELMGIRKTDVEIVKSFVSRTDDAFRQSYGVYVENHPRQCIIVGSTNDENGFLRDITGNRRFWPVKVNGVSPKKTLDVK